MPPSGFEPETFALQERRSRPLSYEGFMNMAPHPTRLLMFIYQRKYERISFIDYPPKHFERTTSTINNIYIMSK